MYVPLTGIPRDMRGTMSVPLFLVWGVQTDLINRVILAIWKVSGQPSDQQLGCNYMSAFAVGYSQLNTPYLSKFLNALLQVDDR